MRAARPCERSRQDGLHYLGVNEYAKWDALVAVSPQGSLFSKSWWLEAIGGEIRILGYYESGRLIAGIPLYFERRMGVRCETWSKAFKCFRRKECEPSQFKGLITIPAPA